jgi:hypothetical protein
MRKKYSVNAAMQIYLTGFFQSGKRGQLSWRPLTARQRSAIIQKSILRRVFFRNVFPGIETDQPAHLHSGLRQLGEHHPPRDGAHPTFGGCRTRETRNAGASCRAQHYRRFARRNSDYPRTLRSLPWLAASVGVVEGAAICHRADHGCAAAVFAGDVWQAPARGGDDSRGATIYHWRY